MVETEPDIEQAITSTREVIGEQAFAESWKSGRALVPDQALDTAQDLVMQASHDAAAS